MNILHLVSYSVFSGPLPPTLQLALAQRELGHTVWLAHDSLRGAFSPFEEGADGPMGQAALAPPIALGLSPKAGLRQLWRDRAALGALVCEHKVDVVHSHLSHDHALVALAGLAGRARRVHTVHANRQLSRQPWRTWLWRHTDAVALRSNSTAPRLHAAEGGRRQLRVATIPASIDVAAWGPAAGDDHQGQAAQLRRAWGIAADAPLLVHVALMAQRGQRELILAWAMVHRIWRQACAGRTLPVLVFVGDGPDRAELTALAAQLGIAEHVQCVGYVPHHRLRPIYWAADGAFLAQPGNDGGARAALEAMASGLPLVAVTEYGVLAELMAQGYGFGAPDRTPAAIAQALMGWLTSPDLGRGLGFEARAWLQRARSPTAEAEATLDLYRG